MPVLADGVRVRVQQLRPQRVQALVVQTEVFLQGAIGHATAASEKLDRFVEHPVEVHDRPFDACFPRWKHLINSVARPLRISSATPDLPLRDDERPAQL